MVVVYKHETGTAIPPTSFCFPSSSSSRWIRLQEPFCFCVCSDYFTAAPSGGRSCEKPSKDCGVPRKRRVFEAAAWRRDAGVGAQPQRAGQHIVLPPVADFLALLFLVSSCFLRLKSDCVSRCGGGVRLSPGHFRPRPSSGACRCLKKERKCPVCVYEPVSLCECVSVHVVLSLCGCLLKRIAVERCHH